MKQGALQQEFEIWIDGSAMENGRFMGAGWVVCDHQTHHYTEYSSALARQHKGSSTIAEIEAAKLALLTIPAGAVVKLHTDCLAVMDILQAPTWPQKLARNASKARQILGDTLTGLFQSKADKKLTVIPVKTSDDDPHLKEAHYLAQEGAIKTKACRP